MKKAILFDLDGTLWDSSNEVAVSWSMALEPYGLAVTQQEVQSVMGRTLPEIARLLLPDHSEEDCRRIIRKCCKMEEDYLRAHGATLFPDLEEILEALSQKYDLAIVSNCQEGYIEAFLDYYGFWKYFQDTENAGRTGRSKGENIRMVLLRNGYTHAIYVGDTQKDCDAADFAHLPFVHAGYGFGTIDRPCPRLNSLAELPALAEDLLG